MVSVVESDLIRFDEFEYASFLNGIGEVPLPGELASRVRPLKQEAAKIVCELADTFVKLFRSKESTYPYATPYLASVLIDPERYHVVTDHWFDFDTPEGIRANREWFQSLPIAPEEALYIWWYDKPAAAVTDWNTFSEIFAEYRRRYFVRVFDDSFAWALMMGPEPAAVFAVEGAVDPMLINMPLLHPAYGPILVGGTRVHSFEKMGTRPKKRR